MLLKLLSSSYKVLCIALILLSCLPVQAQEEQTEPGVAVAVPVTVDNGPEDALGRGNPRGSITGFLISASEFNFEKAAEYLDLQGLPPDIEAVGGPELAREFNHVLARSIWFDDHSTSASAEGELGDDLPEDRDLLVKIPTSSGDVAIWMQRVPRSDGQRVWKISNRSVALIPTLYDEFSYAPPVEKIRTWFPENASFLGLELFKWFIIIVVAFLCWPVYRLAGILLSRVFSSPAKATYPLFRKIFTGPLVFLAILLTVGAAVIHLGAGALAQRVMGTYTLLIIALTWTLWAVINLFKALQQEKLNKAGRPGAAKLMQPLTTLTKILIFVFGLLFWLNNIGVNITTLLAGLGVGGLAVALALQKPIEDMMGALSIFSQAPIRVGDFCRYGTEMGVVEEIGLRTTRLRTLTNSVVSIPNSRIASVEIENLSYRTKIRYWPTLRLRYDTSSDQLRTIMDRIRETLAQHEMIDDEPLRVRFTDFDDDAVLIKIHSFVKTTNVEEFLEAAEDLNLRIMEIVRAAGTSFALPGRSIFPEGEVKPN
jgi:MscS family membrane protein